VIVSFKDADTKALFETGNNKRWTNIKKVAIRKLDQMEASSQLNFLATPPGNRLETLAGNRAGQHSIRINDQFRICFVWKSDGAYDVEITDYH
jgi:proteic killer suppression protein